MTFLPHQQQRSSTRRSEAQPKRWLTLAALIFLLSVVQGFVISTNLRHGSSVRCSAFSQRPDESKADYYKRISEAASDPIAFERMALGKEEPAAASTTTTETNGKSSGGYQRVEDWDKEQEELVKEMSWENRVRFDGQRNGNKFNQNEILRRNLNTY
jgi:hypothetical protein